MALWGLCSVMCRDGMFSGVTWCYVALRGVMWGFVALCGVMWRYLALFGVLRRYVALCGVMGVMWCHVAFFCVI